MSDFLSALKFQVAANCSLAAALVKLVSGGVMHDDETSGGAVGVPSVGRPLVRDRNNDVVGDTLCGAHLKERYGITRHADQPNVLEVDFQHFRFVRDVRRKLYGDRRSPLAGREVKP